MTSVKGIYTLGKIYFNIKSYAHQASLVSSLAFISLFSPHSFPSIHLCQRLFKVSMIPSEIPPTCNGVLSATLMRVTDKA